MMDSIGFNIRFFLGRKVLGVTCRANDARMRVLYSNSFFFFRYWRCRRWRRDFLLEMRVDTIDDSPTDDAKGGATAAAV